MKIEYSLTIDDLGDQLRYLIGFGGFLRSVTRLNSQMGATLCGIYLMFIGLLMGGVGALCFAISFPGAGLFILGGSMLVGDFVCMSILFANLRPKRLRQLFDKDPDLRHPFSIELNDDGLHISSQTATNTLAPAALAKISISRKLLIITDVYGHFYPIPDVSSATRPNSTRGISHYLATSKPPERKT
jgi:hypothetical protein